MPTVFTTAPGALDRTATAAIDTAAIDTGRLDEDIDAVVAKAVQAATAAWAERSPR